MNIESNNLNTNSQEKIKVVYTALFVSDIEGLKAMFPPKHKNVYAHHSTIEFLPSNINNIEVGKKYKIKVIGRAFDEKGDALLVENPKSKNKFPHITLSCADGISPIYSNELLEKAVQNGTIEFFKTPFEIDVVEGFSDGRTDFISVKE